MSDIHDSAELTKLANQLLEGTQFMHEAGIAHCDLKPDNLALSDDGQLYILDYSLSHWLSENDGKAKGYRGTPGWTAPEVGSGSGFYSLKYADVWACGKIINYLAGLVGGLDSRLPICNVAAQLMHPVPEQRMSLTAAVDLIAGPHTQGIRRLSPSPLAKRFRRGSDPLISAEPKKYSRFTLRIR